MFEFDLCNYIFLCHLCVLCVCVGVTDVELLSNTPKSSHFLYVIQSENVYALSGLLPTRTIADGSNFRWITLKMRLDSKLLGRISRRLQLQVELLSSTRRN